MVADLRLMERTMLAEKDTQKRGEKAYERNTPAGALGAMQTALPWKRMEGKRRQGGGD